MSVATKIIKSVSVKWKELKILQSDSLKEITQHNLEKLKSSILKNDFICTFYVWQDEGGLIWVLDGVHRIKALTALADENIVIPDEFPANFISCKNRKEAANYVLLFSSLYAKVTSFGLADFISLEDIDLTDLSKMVSIPDIDVEAILKDTGNVDTFISDLEDGDSFIKPKKKDVSFKYICNKCGFEW